MGSNVNVKKEALNRRKNETREWIDEEYNYNAMPTFTEYCAIGALVYRTPRIYTIQYTAQLKRFN